MDEPITSAVVLPEPETTRSPPASPPSADRTGKRRPSDSIEYTDMDQKRRRVEREDNRTRTTPFGDSHHSTPDMRREPTEAEKTEKRRAQRLFGGITKTLRTSSQRNDQSILQRRAEMERRAQSKKLEQEKYDEEEKRERDRLQLAENRRFKLMVKAESLRLEAENELHEAQYFLTTAEPRLFWRPAKLSSAQEDQIEYQIERAHDNIERRQHDFEKECERVEASIRREEAPLEPVASRHGDARTKSQDFSHGHLHRPHSPPHSNDPRTAQGRSSAEQFGGIIQGPLASVNPNIEAEPGDENTEEVLEKAEEDMVIY